MCGILGAITKDKNLFLDFPKYMESLQHRGPDGMGLNMFPFDAFYFIGAHTRLKVQDLTNNATQPFTKYNKTLLFNGEIYNIEELKNELLESEDLNLISKSDTEILLTIIHKFGIACLTKLNGMFAFALFDHSTNQLTIARDRMGIKPLFYSIDSKNDQFFFGSSVYALKSIVKSTKINIKKLRRHQILDPFVGYTDETMFEEIMQLGSGEYMVLFENKVIDHKKYYKAGDVFCNPQIVDPEDILMTFEDAVSICLLSDAPVGCTLSGGFDSSLIAKFAVAKNDHLKFFCANPANNDKSIDDCDSYFSRLMYDSIATQNTSLNFIEKGDPWSLEIIDKIVLTLSSPIYDERVLVWHNLYKDAHNNGMTVILNGQGADELWYGYYPKIWRWFSNLYHEELTLEAVHNYIINQVDNSALRNCIKPEILSNIHLLSNEIYLAIINSSKEENSHKRLSCFMLETVLASLLNYEDNMSMLNSIEVRVPFLDYRLVEMALCIDSGKHLQDTFKGKDFLKSVFGACLPKQIIERNKMPLPKGQSVDSYLTDIFRENLNEIKQSRLINELYLVDNFDSLLYNENVDFYGRSKEAMLQIISTWRFEILLN